MDQILLELVRYVITLPADASIAWRFALLVVVVVGVGHGARASVWLESHQRFIDAQRRNGSTQSGGSQIKAKHKLLPLPPGGGPLVAVLAFCSWAFGRDMSLCCEPRRYATPKVKSKCLLNPRCEHQRVPPTVRGVCPVCTPPPSHLPLSSPTSGLDPWAYDRARHGFCSSGQLVPYDLLCAVRGNSGSACPFFFALPVAVEQLFAVDRPERRGDKRRLPLTALLPSRRRRHAGQSLPPVPGGL